MIIIGIDPGLSGAIGIIRTERDLVEVHDMPVMPLSKTKRQVDLFALSRILGKNRNANMHVFVEQVHSMPHQGVASCFTFGMGYGGIQGILAALEIPFTLVTPQKWKKHFSLIGKDKKMSIPVAQQHFPSLEIGRKDGRADALLIAEFGATLVAADPLLK